MERPYRITVREMPQSDEAGASIRATARSFCVSDDDSCACRVAIDAETPLDRSRGFSYSIHLDIDLHDCATQNARFSASHGGQAERAVTEALQKVIEDIEARVHAHAIRAGHRNAPLEPPGQPTSDSKRWDSVDEASWASFPASDPPSW